MKTIPAAAVKSEEQGSLGKASGQFDPTKVWNNGHKFFSSQESKAHIELLRKEDSTQRNFESNKYEICRSRNPLNGESTPRDSKGNVVLLFNAKTKVQGGSKILERGKIYPDLSKTSVHQRKKYPIGKIGVPDEKYEVLGNVGGAGTAGAIGCTTRAEPEDLFVLNQKKFLDKSERRQQQEEVKKLIELEKAKRYAKDLLRQASVLRKEAEEKEREMETLRGTYRF